MWVIESAAIRGGVADFFALCNGATAAVALHVVVAAVCGWEAPPVLRVLSENTTLFM